MGRLKSRLKIAVAGTGYVGLSIATLLAQHNAVMAVDIVPRKATGAALGVVGISSYVAAGLQDITSGYLIQGFTRQVEGVDIYDFGPVSWFWIIAAVASFVLPVVNWRKMTKKIN